MNESDQSTVQKAVFSRSLRDSVKGRTRALVFVPIFVKRSANRGHSHKGHLLRSHRSKESRLEEANKLAQAIDLDIVFSDIVSISTLRAATLIGTGKIQGIAQLVEQEQVELVIIDYALTPIQQRNLEKMCNAKVIDRTGLILEIFGRRAQTKEGTLQVELAHLNYQKGRLVRSWTHLERQRGGSGFLGGPGETQIESDRRILQDRISHIRHELETVVRTRKLHRQKRKKVPHPIVALVGYTNAGKSTLFNCMTGAHVLAEDMLFATLDPTLRRIRLPHGETIILSDTVGFISNLPTHLIAAFRATLEEVVEADLIVHVGDISHPDNAAQAEDVKTILKSLGVEWNDPRRVLEVWNKIDCLDDAGRAATLQLSYTAPENLRPIVVSAKNEEGISTLLSVIETRISGMLEHVAFDLQPQEMPLLDWIYQHASNVYQKKHEDGSLHIEADMTATARKIIAERRRIQ